MTGDASPVHFALEPADSADAQACLFAYFTELDQRFPRGFEPARAGSADSVEVSPPRGAFVILRSGGLARGCGALRTLEPGIGEIKRMWLHPDVRGRGLGRRLLEELEKQAHALGFRRVRLDTSAHLPEAIALYRKAGYVEIAPYNDNPYAAHWFEKALA